MRDTSFPPFRKSPLSSALPTFIGNVDKCEEIFSLQKHHILTNITHGSREAILRIIAMLNEINFGGPNVKRKVLIETQYGRLALE